MALVGGLDWAYGRKELLTLSKNLPAYQRKKRNGLQYLSKNRSTADESVY